MRLDPAHVVVAGAIVFMVISLILILVWGLVTLIRQNRRDHRRVTPPPYIERQKRQ